MQALENRKDFSCKFIFKSNAIIREFNSVIFFCMCQLIICELTCGHQGVSNTNGWLHVGLHELQRIAQKVLKQLSELRGNDFRFRQSIRLHYCIELLNLELQS